MTARLSLFAALALLIASQLALPADLRAHPHIIHVADKTEVAPAQLIDNLDDVQVIFIGEFHDHMGHHQAQLSVIDALARRSMPLAIGLEMFRKESQATLNQWVANQINFREFLPIYLDNWSMWKEYRRIFHYARDNDIPMVGLNLSREITAKVARGGMDSLSEEQRQMLGNVQCVVTPMYSEYLRQAMGGHGGHGENFLHFCEAQMLWDTIMARNVVEYVQNNPDHRMVVLAGSGHAWKFGIPRQMLDQADISYRVILPEVFGRIDRENVTERIADYIWLDVGEDGWEF